MESRCRLEKPLYLLALPALFLATGLVAFEGEVFAVTGARALLVASDLGLAADFFAAAFLAGFVAAASASALGGVLAALAFLPPRLEPPPLAARSSSKAIASGNVMVSVVLSLGMVALIPPEVT